MVYTLLKKLIKKIAGRQAYVYLLNTKFGTILHNKSHHNSSTSRDFLLQLLPKFSIGIEIGVNEGNFSERILEIVQPKKLYLVDPWKFEPGESYTAGEIIQDQKILDIRHQNVSKKFKNEIKNEQVIISRTISEEILLKFDDNYFDWIYIDGNHFYEFVKKDLELSYNKLKNNGLITGDDYSENDEWSNNGVKKAVDEFINSKKVEVIELKNYQFILKKRTDFIKSNL